MTEEQFQEAAELWRKGVITQEIADHFGISKVAMSYYASTRRHMFPRRGSSFLSAHARKANPENVAAKTKPVIKPKFPDKAPGHDGVPVGKLTACGCVFPLWGHHETFDLETSLYCGAASEEKHHYCTFHRKLSVGPGTRSERNATASLKAAA
jgi:hypothetical protein